MDKSAPVFNEGRLRVYWLMKRRIPRVKFCGISDLRTHLDFVSKTIKGGSIGLYVHIPFCKSICMFCPYFRVVLRDRRELEAYFEVVLKEIEVYSKLLENRDLSVVEIHVGGGTPSLVPPKFYRELLDRISMFSDVKCGIGIEANPEDFTHYEYVEDLYSAGVDEVSIGVQSFDERVLKSLGRKHKPGDNVKAVENSLKAGFKWVNADVMFLSPSIKSYIELSTSEKLEIFRKDLEKCYGLGVHQVTYYPTVVPKSSPGYRLVELGRVSQELGSIDDFLDKALDFAEEYNLHLVRVYSASRRRYEYATVNLEMVGPLIGVGAGAWSNTGFYQYINVHDVAKYIDMVKKESLAAAYARHLNPSSRAWKLFFDQLSAIEVREEVFKSIGLRSIPLGAKLLLKAMELAGLVEKKSGAYKLTRYGIKEVYKAVMNYVVEIPVKATETFTQASSSESSTCIQIPR